MLVAADGQVVLHEAVGYQDIDTRAAMSIETLFQIQSMTKPVTAVAAMILIEDGLLRLSDPVANYLPEFRARAPLRRIASRPRSESPVRLHSSRGWTTVDCARFVHLLPDDASGILVLVAHNGIILLVSRRRWV